MRIWVNGCFDVLHVGHIRLLRYAKSLGDTLTVVIGSDYRNKRVIGSQYSEVAFFDKIEGHSTTNLVEKFSQWRTKWNL